MHRLRLCHRNVPAGDPGGGGRVDAPQRRAARPVPSAARLRPGGRPTADRLLHHLLATGRRRGAGHARRVDRTMWPPGSIADGSPRSLSSPQPAMSGFRSQADDWCWRATAVRALWTASTRGTDDHLSTAAHRRGGQATPGQQPPDSGSIGPAWPRRHLVSAEADRSLRASAGPDTSRAARVCVAKCPPNPSAPSTAGSRARSKGEPCSHRRGSP